jgi:hypothetical protein
MSDATARPADLHVLSEIVVFGPTTTHHVVALQDGEREALRLFVRKPGKGLGRFHDQEGMRLFSHEWKETFDRNAHNDVAPIVEHASLAAFFEAVGYSFRKNAYSPRQEAIAA